MPKPPKLELPRAFTDRNLLTLGGFSMVAVDSAAIGGAEEKNEGGHEDEEYDLIEPEGHDAWVGAAELRGGGKASWTTLRLLRLVGMGKKSGSSRVHVAGYHGRPTVL